MFTGIIECVGKVEEIVIEQSNCHFRISSTISQELKIDQSLSHNGVCLTVTAVESDYHWATAVRETLEKSNLGLLKTSELVNLERCLQMNGRLDGHIVQGHVDGTGVCTDVRDKDGSWEFEFSFDRQFAHLMVPKGSVCINGVSLTVNNPAIDTFYVAIIPYTYENTGFKTLKIGDRVNLEFDIIGKYLARYREITQNH